MEYLIAECPHCKGTGISWVEQALGFICSPCGGAGSIRVKSKPFTGKKRKTGVEHVCHEFGRPAITYEEFVAGKTPGK